MNQKFDIFKVIYQYKIHSTLKKNIWSSRICFDMNCVLCVIIPLFQQSTADINNDRGFFCVVKAWPNNIHKPKMYTLDFSVCKH